MYRSSRFIFIEYEIGTADSGTSFFIIYNTQTGISVNSEYTRYELFGTMKRRFRPIRNNTELFYYFHTHMDSDDWEEPNPTLYIGRLKKQE